MKWLRDNWVLTGAILLLLLFFTSFWIWYGDYDIFRLPFQADVHGTLSDWVMVGVTAVTAYYLWRTLKSQTEVQEMQKDMLELAQRDRISRIKPRFVTGEQPNNIFTRITRMNKSIALLSPRFDVKLLDASATNVHCEIVVHINGEEICKDDRFYGDIDVNSSFKVIFEYVEIDTTRSRGIGEIYAKLNFLFDDVDSNNYRQYIKYTPRVDKWSGSPSAVKLIKMADPSV